MLVKCGFHSIEGLLAAEADDLAEIIGADKATEVQTAAAAEQQRRLAGEQQQPQ